MESHSECYNERHRRSCTGYVVLQGKILNIGGDIVDIINSGKTMGGGAGGVANMYHHPSPKHTKCIGNSCETVQTYNL